MLEKADQRGRICVLLMCSAGLRIGALPSLRIRNLERIEKYQLYKITVYENEDEEYITFCTPECTSAIDSYLEYRQRHGEHPLKDDSPLIREEFDINDEIKAANPKGLGIEAFRKMIKGIGFRSGVIEKRATPTGELAKRRPGPTLLLRTPDSPHLVKMKWDSSRNDLNAITCISNLAMLLGSLRREGAAWSKDKAENSDTEYFAGPMEDVIRAGQVLTNLARGHALITGRNYITMEDIPIVLKTVLSTARIQRVTSFIALLDNKGKITVSEMSSQISVSHSTAYRLATELMAVGLVDLISTNDMEYLPDINNPAMQKVLTLKKEFEWCLSNEFKQLREGFTPVDNRKFMKEKDPEQQAAKEAADIKTQQRAAYDTARAKIAKAKRKK